MFENEWRQEWPRWTRRAIVGSGLALGGLLAGRSIRGLAAPEATPASCPATTEAENRAVVQRWYDTLDAGDVDAFPIVLAPVIVQHAADFADARGVADVQASFEPFLAAFPDLRHEIEQWVVDGDLVAVRGMGYGTHHGEFAGVAPTRQEIRWHLLAIYRIECGRIAEHWSEVDALGRLRQLGATPPRGATPAGDPPLEGTTAPTDGTPAVCPATTERENADLVQRWFDGVWTGRDLGQLDRFLTVDHRLHPVLGRSASGIDARAEAIREWHAAFPALAITLDFLLTDGDLVAARWMAAGTHLGPWEDIPPTGTEATWTGNSIFRIACGRIAEEWSEVDGLSLYRQLGAVR